LTDVESFAVLEPKADGFRNYFSHSIDRPGEELLVDRAQMLTLTAPEMTVLVGGLRVLNANAGSTGHGSLHEESRNPDERLLCQPARHGHEWKKSAVCEHFFEGRDRKSGEVKWTASSVDLVFGSNSQLRAISEVYASEDGKDKFVSDFVAVWNKVMNLDRFDPLSFCKAPRRGQRYVTLLDHDAR
jgi:catalase-peroxidase